MQSEKEPFPSADAELSNTWQELLGGRLLNGESLETANASPTQEEAGAQEVQKDAIPTLSSDPWSTLVQARGTEMVDLNQLHLHMSDQDVEQVLQLMQEEPSSQPQQHQKLSD